MMQKQSKIIKKWTHKDVKSLIYMKNSNFSLRDISSFFQITVNAVSKALIRYHEGYVKSSETQDEVMAKRIHTLSGAISFFNKFSSQMIYCSGVHEYTYGEQEGLTSVSILVIINSWRQKNNSDIFKIYNLAF